MLPPNSDNSNLISEIIDTIKNAMKLSQDIIVGKFTLQQAISETSNFIGELLNVSLKHGELK